MHTIEFLSTLRRAIHPSHVAANELANLARVPRPYADPQARTRARPQPIARTRSRHPVAVCTRCNTFSFLAHSIGEKCGRSTNGRPCPGALAATAMSREWQKCAACLGTGWHGNMVCMHCQSLGWRFFRRH